RLAGFGVSTEGCLRYRFVSIEQQGLRMQMSPSEVIAALRQGAGELGKRFEVAPPLPPDQIEQLEVRTGGRIHSDAQRILAFASGIRTGSFGLVDFCGRFSWEPGDISPVGIPVALDRRGNAWVQD